MMSVGMWVSKQSGGVFEEHFKNLFTSEDQPINGDILHCVDSVISQATNDNLLQAITMEEIKEAAMQMGGLKAPGPDGYQGIFFHKYWDTIYDEVRGITVDFFSNNQSLGALNTTNLVLIPKIPNPEGVSHFRPISLCNFSFKIVSKVMANRLKVFLPQIISPGQNAFQINFGKSSIFFSPNTPASIRTELGAILGMTMVDDPGKYLGLPTMWGRSKKEALQFVREKLLRKLSGWKQSLLSQAGREVLIKAVAQAVPNYPMGVFLFPKSFCTKMESEIANFWWGQKQEERKIHWVRWTELGLPKHEGGMGFRDFHDFNLALLAKQCWRLLTEPNSLWARLIKARYFPECNFMEATKGSRASWAWARGALCPAPGAFVDRNATVETIIDWNSRTWKLDLIRPLLSTEEALAIQRIPIGSSSEVDRLVWPDEKNGKYSVRSGYHNIHSHHHRNSVRRPSSSISIDQRKKLRNSPICPICNDHEETIEHTLLLCPWVEPVWFGGLSYKTRNKVVFDNFTPQPQQTLKTIFDQVNERSSLKHLITSSSIRSVHPSAQASWAAPAEPFVKINVDAAWRKSTCPENALMAEANALWEGCIFAKERCHNMVCFESDSLELIKCGIGPPGIVIKRRIISRRWHYRGGERKFGLNDPPPLLCISFVRMDSLVLTMPNLVVDWS
ncbi:unnamed protein product [Prunus brigantina]